MRHPRWYLATRLGYVILGWQLYEAAVGCRTGSHGLVKLEARQAQALTPPSRLLRLIQSPGGILVVAYFNHPAVQLGRLSQAETFQLGSTLVLFVCSLRVTGFNASCRPKVGTNRQISWVPHGECRKTECQNQMIGHRAEVLPKRNVRPRMIR